MQRIKCPGCGAENWLTPAANCRDCGVVLRRCVDCRSDDRGRALCRTTHAEVDAQEAQHPTALAASTLCKQYAPLPARLAA